jgi:methionine-rich copper-binding protein CopC
MFALLHDFTRTLVWLIFIMGLVSIGERTNAAFTISDASTLPELKAGTPAAATVAIESNAEMNDVNVQVAIVDETRRVVAKQNFKDNQFRSGETRTFRARFPASLKAGSYSVSVTIFGPNWTPTFHFEEDLAKFDVLAPVKAVKGP